MYFLWVQCIFASYVYVLVHMWMCVSQSIFILLTFVRSDSILDWCCYLKHISFIYYYYCFHHVWRWIFDENSLQAARRSTAQKPIWCFESSTSYCRNRLCLQFSYSLKRFRQCFCQKLWFYERFQIRNSFCFIEMCSFYSRHGDVPMFKIYFWYILNERWWN